MKKILVVFALFAALIFVISCGGGDNNPKTNEDGGNSETSSEEDDSYAETEPTDPKEIRVSECTGLPEHAQWNTVSEIRQRWDGRSWQPPKKGSYNETPSTSECRFKCVADYHWDGSACIVDCDPDSLPTLPECSESSGTPCEDSSTGLIWSKEKYAKTWSDAVSYCNNLWKEGGVCGGWHLPTIGELRTLIIRCEGSMPGGSCALPYDGGCSSNDCCCEETGGGFFSKLGDSGSFWSKNDCGYDPDCDNGYCGRSWGVDFFNAGVLCLNKYDYNGDEITHGVRCVNIRRTDILYCYASTMCKDPSSGLTWSAKASESYSWQDAVDYCTSLNSSNYGGYSSGWHLPTISELRTLIQNCSNTESEGECGVSESCLSYSECRYDACSGCSSDSSGKYSKFGETGGFWSSSTELFATDYAWSVGFYDGRVSYSLKSNEGYVRCVR